MKKLFVVMALIIPSSVLAEDQYKKLPSFTAHHTGDGEISRFLDSQLGVVCYMLHPNIMYGNSKSKGFQYDGNAIGSISCVKLDKKK